jgi:uncharacterized protein
MLLGCIYRTRKLLAWYNQLMTDDDYIAKTADFIKARFNKESTGHDWWHMYRVWQLAKHINKTEKADQLVVELGALLHDIADWKFYEDEEEGPRAARAWLESLKVDSKVISHIEDIIRNVSFKGAQVKNKLSTKEGQIIHDADKLDAIGAIGIARAFAYGGANNHQMYEPGRETVHHKTFDAYKNDVTGTINHFHDKLLLLKDRMFTKTGKEIAERRHEFMQQYLDEFYAEWDGKL